MAGRVASRWQPNQGLTLLMLTLVPLIRTLTGPDGLAAAAGAPAGAAPPGPPAAGLELMVRVRVGTAAAGGLAAGGAGGPVGFGAGGPADALAGAAAGAAAGFGAGGPTCQQAALGLSAMYVKQSCVGN